jgi:transposase
MRLSVEQIQSFLKDTAAFNLSDGEIIRALDEQAEKLIPENERLKQKMRAGPGRHYDETGWKVQKEGQGNYCWITRPTIGEEALFFMGRSRGKGNAEAIRGQADDQVGISDDYAGYDNLFANHQLCIAHPQRKFRDLSQTKTLTTIRQQSCQKTYQSFSDLYKQLRETLATVYDKQAWEAKRLEYLKSLKKITVITRNDPEKLKTLKTTLAQNAEKYFTCLLFPGIPADNNKAERGLRHMVLKRKMSYGSKTQKGADTMSVLASTLLSCWWNKPDNFFVAYNEMLAL